MERREFLRGVAVLGIASSLLENSMAQTSRHEPADFVVIPGIDSPQILDQAFEASGTFRPISKEQVAALLQKTEQAAAHGDYELFKTSQHFDSTAHHPEWLGRQSPHVQHLARPAS